MEYTAEQAEQFKNRGRDIITALAAAVDDFRAYARVFEIRGGRVAIDAAAPDDDPNLGTDTEGMIVFHNDLIAFLAENSNQRQNVLDKFRADY